MRAEVRALHDRLKATSIYVTHDQVEAMTMADRIVVLDKGRIAQAGTPLELYDRPANRFVAEFIGSPAINMFSANVDADRLSIPSGDSRIEIPLPSSVAGKTVDVGIRPEHFLRVDRDGIEGTVRVIENLGAETYVFVDANKRSLCWRIPGRPGCRGRREAATGLRAEAHAPVQHLDRHAGLTPAHPGGARCPGDPSQAKRASL